MRKSVKKVLVIKVNCNEWISRKYLVGDEIELKNWMRKYLYRVSMNDNNIVVGCNIDRGYCDVMIGNKKIEIDIVSCKVL